MLNSVGIQADRACFHAASAADAGRFIHAARILYVIYNNPVVCLGHGNVRIRHAEAGHAAAKYDLSRFFRKAAAFADHIADDRSDPQAKVRRALHAAGYRSNAVDQRPPIDHSIRHRRCRAHVHYDCVHFDRELPARNFPASHSLNELFFTALRVLGAHYGNFYTLTPRCRLAHGFNCLWFVILNCNYAALYVERTHHSA